MVHLSTSFMKSSRFVCALCPAIFTGVAGAGWEFVQNGTSGVLALETIIVSPTLAVFFDFATTGDPLMINNHSAWGGLWNLETNEVTALDVVSDTFCASGGLLSNGTMVSCRWYVQYCADYSITHRSALGVT